MTYFNKTILSPNIILHLGIIMPSNFASSLNLKINKMFPFLVFLFSALILIFSIVLTYDISSYSREYKNSQAAINNYIEYYHSIHTHLLLPNQTTLYFNSSKNSNACAKINQTVFDYVNSKDYPISSGFGDFEDVLKAGFITPAYMAGCVSMSKLRSYKKLLSANATIKLNKNTSNFFTNTMGYPTFKQKEQILSIISSAPSKKLICVHDKIQKYLIKNNLTKIALNVKTESGFYNNCGFRPISNK